MEGAAPAAPLKIGRRLLPAALVALAMHSYWPWLWRRSIEPGEPWGLIALAAALAIVVHHSRAPQIERPEPALAWLAASGALLLASVLAWSHVPRLVSATLATLALACALMHALPPPERRRSWGILALIFLALPLGAALDMFVAYPLRLASASLAANWLRAGQIDAARTGVGLLIEGQRSFVDPACSGVRALWTALVLTAAVATLHGLRPVALALSLTLAIALVVVANGMRSAALGFAQVALGQEPAAWLHAGVGLVAFAGLAWLCTTAVERLSVGAAFTAARPAHLGRRPRLRIPIHAFFLAACAFAALLPSARTHTPPQFGAPPPFLGWPETWEGQVLEARGLSPWERRFDAVFPGRTGRFRLPDGRGELVLRWVWAPSRKIHSVRTCFRSEGYETELMPAWRDDAHRTWTRFEARDSQGRRFEVREIVLGSRPDEHWPDPGAWYWSVAMGRWSRGPWWVVTWTVPARSQPPFRSDV